jgi:hypothetical protein
MIMNGLRGITEKALSHLIPGLEKKAACSYFQIAIIKRSAHNSGFSH